jgi:tetratricopeptide (TPR) repeat protein
LDVLNKYYDIRKNSSKFYNVMGSSNDVTLNQLYLVNGVIRKLIEDQGINLELNLNEKPDLSFEKKSKILSMLKVREKINERLSKQQQKQSFDKTLETLIGNFYSHDKEYQKALVYYDRALRSDPHEINAIIGKGVVTSKLGKHKEAIALFDKALEIDPQYFDALHCKGDSLTLLSKHS